MTRPPHLVGLRIDALDALRKEEDAIVVASATALAEAVLGIAHTPARAAALSESSRALAARCSWASIADAHIEIYSRL